jgi:hypothetical protein
MCLIITGQSNKIRATLTNTHGLLSDIFTSNPDGIGIMYATTKGLKIVKTLPKNYADAFAFIGKLPDDDRELAIHFRWTTHGNTDLTNCHPYDVVNGYVAMMHNGILHTGNKADTTKSDTWHFIKDYLAEAVHEHPALVHNAGYLTMIAEFIGDNRFVFMDGDGRMSHVNYDQGVEHEGMWFSNTYAWSPSRLIPNYYKSTKKAYKSYAYADAYYDEVYDDELNTWNNSFGIKPKTTPLSIVPEYMMEEMAEYHGALLPTLDNLCVVLENCDVDALVDMIDFHPNDTLTNLFKYFKPEVNKYFKQDQFSSKENDIARMIQDNDVAALLDTAYDSTVSEVLCYYFDWIAREGVAV